MIRGFLFRILIWATYICRSALADALLIRHSGAGASATLAVAIRCV